MPAIRRYRPGLTLIELLMVIAVMAILAASIIPSVNGNFTENVRGAARIVAQDLGYARSLAVLNNSTYRLTFHLQNNRYTLTHVGANASYNTLPANPFAGPGSTATQQITDFDDLPVLAGTRVSLHDVKSGTQSETTLDFGPLGNTSRTDETVVWLTSGAGGAQRWVAVRVNPATGLVSIDEIQAASPDAGGASGSGVGPLDGGASPPLP